MPDLQTLLKSKQPKVTEVTFPIGEDGQQRAKDYEQAEGDLKLLELMNLKATDGKQVDLAKAKSAVTKARKRYLQRSVTLRFRGLDPVEHDALVSEFTSPNEDTPVDMRGYTCALLALTALDSEITREQWDAELYESGRWSKGEVDLIRDTARAAYMEAEAPGIPKG